MTLRLTPADRFVLLELRSAGAVLGPSAVKAAPLGLSTMTLGRLRKHGLVESERRAEGIGYERRYHTVYWLTPEGHTMAGQLDDEAG